MIDRIMGTNIKEICGGVSYVAYGRPVGNVVLNPSFTGCWLALA